MTASVFERFGGPVIINAKGTATRLSGGTMAPEVADAMHEATQSCVDMCALQAAASRVIAGHTGAEAGYVTSGASAGLLVMLSSCILPYVLIFLDLISSISSNNAHGSTTTPLPMTEILFFLTIPEGSNLSL